MPIATDCKSDGFDGCRIGECRHWFVSAYLAVSLRKRQTKNKEDTKRLLVIT